MSNQRSSETRFERCLREDLEAVVANRGAQQAAETSRREVLPTPTWRRRAPRLGVAGAAVAVIAAVALIVSAGDGGTPAAFAVEPQPEGKISVEVRSLEDSAGLERALDEAGIQASVTYLASGMTCKEPRFQAASPAEGEQGALISGPVDGEGPINFTIGRDEVGPGQTLVITAWPGPGVLLLGGAETKIAEGAVGPCEPVPATDGGSSGN